MVWLVPHSANWTICPVKCLRAGCLQLLHLIFLENRFDGQSKIQVGLGPYSADSTCGLFYGNWLVSRIDLNQLMKVGTICAAEIGFESEIGVCYSFCVIIGFAIVCVRQLRICVSTLIFGKLQVAMQSSWVSEHFTPQTFHPSTFHPWTFNPEDI